MIDFLPDLIRDYGYAALFFLMLIEAFIPLFPTEIVIPLAGALASRGQMTLAGVIMAGSAGALTGATIWYVIARALGYKRFKHLVTRYGWITTLSDHEVERLQAWFERRGGIMVFIARFVPGVRNLISIPAGLIAMPYAKFLSLSLVGVALSNGIFGTGGWMLRNQYDLIERYVGPVTSLIIGTLILVWIVRVIIGLRKRRAADVAP
jgi:membrane protein DedA with SNARE-associated domain